MKNSLIITFLLFICIELYCQKTIKINTENLLTISKTYGLDSVIRMTYEPIYEIDPQTTEKLALEIKNNNYSKNIERFLLDYVANGKSNLFSQFLNDFIDKKTKLVSTYKIEDYNGGFPKITNEEIYLICKHKNKNTEKLLSDYYNAWLEKSYKFKLDYQKGMLEREKLLNDSASNLSALEADSLLTPYKNCCHNCLMVLLALKQLNSNTSNQDIISNYKIVNEEFDKKNLFRDSGIYKNSSYNQKQSIIKLKNKYKSIGEIDFYHEPNLKEILFFNDNRLITTLEVIYNQSIGIVTSYSVNSSSRSKMKLKGESKLIIYEGEELYY
ncbi:MAG: hypothetical protein PHR83_13810 [Paludibacter sp.]|nr:hypothetical protein [Paludibacter sp.]